MKCHQTEQPTMGRSAAGYTYPKGRLLPSCFGLRNFAGFRVTKTSANKRFYNMSAKSIAQLCAAKLQHFFELCKSLYRKECLPLRYGFGIPS